MSQGYIKVAGSYVVIQNTLVDTTPVLQTLTNYLSYGGLNQVFFERGVGPGPDIPMSAIEGSLRLYEADDFRSFEADDNRIFEA